MHDAGAADVPRGLRRLPGLLLWPTIAAMLATQLLDGLLPGGGSRPNMVHLGLAGVIVILSFLERRVSVPRWTFGLVTLAAFVLAHAYLYAVQPALYLRSLWATVPDIVAGLTLIVLVLYYSWYTFGWAFTGLGLVFLLYPFVAADMPGPLRGPSLDLQHILSRLALRFHGGFISYARDFIWLLLFWGQLLTVAGAGVSILWLARTLTRTLASGPAMATLLSSAFVGTFTGAGANNAAITGPLTIPAMKRAGYPAAWAGAMEGLASNAAGITPPVLGTVAFIMADLLGISYFNILLMALVPAVLYYTAIAVYIAAYTRRHRRQLHLSASREPEAALSWHLVLRSAAIGFVPVAVLTVMVLQGGPFREATRVTFMVTLVLALLLRVETRWRTWAAGVRSSAILASAVTLTLAVLALVQNVMAFTGLGTRLGDIIEAASFGHLLLAVLLTMVAGILLGGPLPALPVYFIMALTFAPVLARMGVPLPVSHFVAFYMGLLGSITPPVAESALITGVIARSSYWQVSMEMVRIGWLLLLFPALFVFAPELLLGAGAPAGPGAVLYALLLALVAYVVGALAAAGWLFTDMTRRTRLLAYAVPAVVFYAVFADYRALGVVALSLAATLVTAQWLLARGLRRAHLAPAPVPPPG